MKNLQDSRKHEHGKSVTELLIIVAIVGVVTVFSLMRINTARASIRLNSTARTMLSYMEKARTDSIRRHATATSQMASVEVLSSTVYRVTMDFGGNGTMTTRDVTVENGVSITIPNDPTTGFPAPPRAVFDWRGKNSGEESVVLTNGTSQVTVNITDAGDVTLNSNLALPTPAIANINPLSDIKPEAVINASSSGCVITTNVTTLSLQRNRTGTVRITISSATGTNTITADTTSTLITLSPISQNVNGNGSVNFSVRASNRRGTYGVTFSSPCGAKTVAVVVS